MRWNKWRFQGRGQMNKFSSSLPLPHLVESEGSHLRPPICQGIHNRVDEGLMGKGEAGRAKTLFRFEKKNKRAGIENREGGERLSRHARREKQLGVAWVGLIVPLRSAREREPPGLPRGSLWEGA